LIIVLMVVALVALLVGLFYFAIPADKIPSWLPGRVVTPTAHHMRRATALVVVGVLCAVAAGMVPDGRRPQDARRDQPKVAAAWRAIRHNRAGFDRS
jgi:hypothetical protein